MWGFRRKLKDAWPPEPEKAPSAADLAETARGLAGAGRHRQAIDLLAPLPAETLRDLVLWRRAAFDPQPACSAWPRRYADPFPGVQEPPEIAIAELTATVLGGAIQHHGCLLVRGMIDPEQTAQLSEVVRKAFDTAGAIRSGALQADASAWYSPYPLGPDDGMKETGREFGLTCGGIWTADSPRALSDFIAFLKAHGITEVIEEYLGERAFLSLGKSTLRIVPPTTSTNWHQDGAFLGPDIRTVNVWLSLSDCGDDAPGLDLFPRRLEQLAETGTKGAFASWTVGDGVLEEMTKTVPVVTPRFKAGDAMLFDQLFLHRTGVRPGMTRERLAIESWFFAGATVPMKQIPLAL